MAVGGIYMDGRLCGKREESHVIELASTRFSLRVEDDEWADAGRDALVSVLLDQILRRSERGQEKICFPWSAGHEQDWQPYSR